MATTLDSDIDRFIRDQKAKLANERHILKKDDSYFATDVPRRQWNREEARSAKLAEQIQEERTRTPDGGLPLTNTDSFKKRQELALQRKQEYKDFIEKTSQNGRKRLNRPLTPADDMGLPVGQYQKNRRELSLQRQKEYQEYLQQKQKSQDNSLRTAKDGQLSDYQLMSKQLSQQKRQEYNQLDKMQQETIHHLPNILEREERKFLGNPKSMQKIYEETLDKTSHGHHEDILKKLEEQYKLLRTDAEKKYLKAALEDVKQEYEAKWAAQRAQQQQDKSIVDSHTASTNLENGAQGDDYKALWSRVHLEAGVHTPRDNSFGKTGAKFDTDASVQHAMSRLEEVEYRQIWQQMHPQKTEELKENDKRRQWEPVKGKAVPDSSDLAEAVRKKLADERKKEYEEIIKSKSEGNRTWREPSQEKLLPLGSYEQRRKEYGNERNREYNEYLKSNKRETAQRKVWKEPSHEELFPLGKYEETRQKLKNERHQDYKNHLRESDELTPRSNRVWKEPTKEELLPLGQHETVQQKLRQERRQEYGEYLKGKNLNSSRVWKEPSQEEIFPLGKYSDKQEKLRQERHQEYNEFLKKKEASTGGGHTNLVKQTDEYKATFPGMNESDAAKVLLSKREVDPWSKPYVKHDRNFVDIKPYSIQKVRERNAEYNEFLNQKQDREGRSRYGDQKPSLSSREEGVYATLPGLNYSNSASKRRVQERNQEYNEFLRNKGVGTRQVSHGDDDIGRPPPAPRKGWTTPTYEEMLDKKRQQESQYRRLNDPGFSQLPLRSYNSEGALNTLETERRLRELDKEWGAKKIQFQNERATLGILDDPSWLSPSRNPNSKHYDALDDIEVHQPLPSVFDHSLSPRVITTTNPVAHTPQKDSRSNDQSAGYFATLPIGTEGPRVQQPEVGQRDRDSAKQRQKEQYREELQRQMRETQEARRREKQNNLLVNETGLFKSEERKTPTVKVSATPYDPRQAPNKGLEPYHSKILEGLDKLDQLSPRTEVILGRRRFEELDKEQRLGGLSRAGASSSLGTLNLNRSNVTRGGAGTGLLDTRFDSLLEAPRLSTLAPPPGLEYQPASYVTQGGGIGLHSSVDEAYNFFAVRDPLNPNSFSGNGGNTGRGGDFGSAANQELSFAGRGGGGEVRGGAGGARNTRVHFENDRSQGRSKPQTAMDFPTDDDKKQQARQNASSYQEDLNRQIEEKKRKKQLEKEEQERYEMKLEREAQEYNPYGRGGGGAPNRDIYGNLITDLRQMKRINEQGGGGGGGGGGSGSGGGGAPPAPSTFRSPRNPPASVRDDLFGPPPIQMTAEGEQSFARGGHGIFGLPKTDAEKITADRYKDDLKRQIEQKKLEDMQRKEEERREEEREQRRVEEQQRRMQLEYEEEHRKLREKEEEARRKNEELVRQAEERKREAERRRREEDEKRQAELRREREAEINARLAAEERGKSPAIPTLQKKDEGENSGEVRSSPPVPAARTRTAEPEARPRSASRQDYGPPIRSQSADVLNQLAAMRQQLQNERKRVETMLQNERNEPDVFDPRLVQRPPPAPVVRPEIDVFETARNRNAVAVRRTPADRPNPQAVEDFNALKHKDDTDSRTAFRSMFPENPVSSDMLEAQQLALLREQEQHLRNLREQRQFESGYPKTVPLSPRLDSHTPQQLLSNSAFVDVDGMTYFPDDFEDIPTSQRNESARARRRRRIPSSPRLNSEGRIDPFGSTSSLNVDRLAKKNEDRLKRLRELQGDDLSLYDADDVLDRFMSKQAHNRPPSRQTLQDDTWMFAGAGSKASGY